MHTSLLISNFMSDCMLYILKQFYGSLYTIINMFSKANVSSNITKNKYNYYFACIMRGQLHLPCKKVITAKITSSGEAVKAICSHLHSALNQKVKITMWHCTTKGVLWFSNFYGIRISVDGIIFVLVFMIPIHHLFPS